MRHKIGPAAALVAVTAVLSACSPAGGDRAGGTGWSYTDDRGVTITAEQRPERIIAQVSSAAALKDFGVDVVGTFGPLVRDDGTVEPEARGLDPRAVTDVTGPGYGEVAMERVASLEPDLLVSGKYAEFPGLWHLTAEQEEQVKSLVPTAGVQHAGVPLPETIASYRDLAAALGGDVDAARVRADEAAFHAAADRLRGIGERMKASGRTILAVGGTEQEFFAVVPGRNPDLDFYVRELGLPIIVPDHPDTAGGGYFERLSWEHAAAYPADILLWDTRAASLPPERMMENPVFAARPSAAAGRFVEWDAVAPMSYASYAGIMTELADQLEAKLGGR
ncbi:ABC transporter substrate-binding protein [Saccharopolyspora sp. CA-218241]|uniref:ABC transporter substrate-binding protein n=1 Tax=Saccharopolyspora sp. CA-218241 TaxID=3240027 RepID=UPI003D96C294